MADIKNFGIRGIGSDVQFGKAGGRVVYDSGNSLFKVTTDGSTLGNMNVATPTLDDHAANKAYVDSVAQGLDVKDSVRAASTGDVNVGTPASTMDGVNLSDGDRVLLKDQTTASQNGIYVYASTGLTRAIDMDTAGEFVGAFFFVEEGTVNSDQGYVMSANGTIDVGTTDIEFTKFTGTGQITAGDALSKSGNTLNVNVDGTYIMVDGSDNLTVKGTSTTGEVLQSDGSGGVAYGAVDLTNLNATSGALPLTRGGLGVDASQTAGKQTARDNLGLGSIATQDADSVDISGGVIDISGGTLTLANDQLSGDVISGGTIDSANIQGGAGVTLSQMDITVGAGKTLDVDGVLDVDGAAGSAIDNVVIGGTTSAAGTFSTLETSAADINGGNIDGTVIGATTAANATFADADITGTLKVDTIEAYTTDGDITFNSLIVTTQGINVANAGISNAGTINAGSMSVDTINEKTAGQGVEVDGVVLKDAGVAATGVSTFADLTATTADINGGTIDETVIGASTSAAGTFSAMTTADATITGGSISATNVDLTGQTIALDDDQLSGDKIDGGSISNFASTGIDDNASATQVTITDTEATFGANVVVEGDLTVQGSLTSIETTNTAITDNSIVLNNGETGAGVSSGTAGIEIDRGTADSATLQWNETDDVWEFKVGTALADLKIGSQAMDAISVDTVNELTPGAGISFADAVSGGDADFSGTVSADTIAEHTVGAGVTADGVVLKDGVVTAGLTAEAGDTVDVSAASLVLADDQISGDKVEGGTINAITINTMTSGTVDIDGGAIDATTIGASTSAAGTFSALTSDSVDLNGGAMDGVTIGADTSAAATFSTMTTDSADINGGAIDGAIIGANAAVAGTFSTMNTVNAQITGGDITGANLTSDVVDFNGGNIDGTVVGASVSAAGTFSTLASNNVDLDGGAIDGTTIGANTSAAGTFSTLTSAAADITGDVDVSAGTLTLADDQINGNKVHGGTISSANLTGSANAMTGYDITVGAGRTLDVASGTLTLADDQISGDKIDGGSISNFASTGMDDNATATVFTLDDTDATFAVNGDFGTNSLTAGDAEFASLDVSGDAVVHGNLTVSGAVTTTLSETVAIEDNIVELNSNVTGAPTEDAGIEVNRGTSSNVSFKWDEANDVWTTGGEKLVAGDTDLGELNLTVNLSLDNGGLGTDTSGFAADSLHKYDGSGAVAELAKGADSTVLKVNSSGALGYGKVELSASEDVNGVLDIVNGGTGLSTVGADNKVLTSDGSAVGYEYVSHMRNGSGVAVVDASNAASGTAEYLDLTNAAGKLTLTAKNASGTGAVDMYLQGQNGGDVFIVGQSGEALIQGEADTDLTVAGGDSSAGAAGDLILKGGNGSANGDSGAVIIKGGNGGSTDGNVQVLGADDTAIATFVETASAADNFVMTNGTGGLELAAAGGSTDVNITLAPKGDGLVMAPSGYDMSAGAGEAFVTKDYVDGSTAGSDDRVRRVSFAANGGSSFTVGTLQNVSGKTYYVNKVTVKVTTAFVGADELLLSDGTNTLVGANDVDLSEGGIYSIDLGYETASAGGSTLTASLQNGGSSASPSTGNVIVTVEFKQM